MYPYKVCCQKFLYFLSGLDVQLEQFENEDPAHKNGFNIAMCNKSSTAFSIDQYQLMA